MSLFILGSVPYGEFLGTKPVVRSLFIRFLGWCLTCQDGVTFNSPFFSLLG